MNEVHSPKKPLIFYYCLLYTSIRRSWLRLRLGKAYYTGKRYLLWCSPKYRWAKTRKEERLPCVQFSHATPLMRHLRGEEMVWQENKVTNLKLAVKRLDGLILYPGETFSYWKRIGKPTARKGYKEGMVLFLGPVSYTHLDVYKRQQQGRCRCCDFFEFSVLKM